MTVTLRTVPRPVHLAVTAWLTAIGAGVVETLVRLAMPDPPTGGELAVRLRSTPRWPCWRSHCARVARRCASS